MPGVIYANHQLTVFMSARALVNNLSSLSSQISADGHSESLSLNPPVWKVLSPQTTSLPTQFIAPFPLGELRRSPNLIKTLNSINQNESAIDLVESLAEKPVLEFIAFRWLMIIHRRRGTRRKSRLRIGKPILFRRRPMPSGSPQAIFTRELH